MQVSLPVGQGEQHSAGKYASQVWLTCADPPECRRVKEVLEIICMLSCAEQDWMPSVDMGTCFKFPLHEKAKRVKMEEICDDHSLK